MCLQGESPPDVAVRTPNNAAVPPADGSTITADSSAETRRVVSIHDDVYAIDNIGFEHDEPDNATSFAFPPHKRKASAPPFLDDRLRRQSRLPSSHSTPSPTNGHGKRMSSGLPRYLSYNSTARPNNAAAMPGSPKTADSASVFSYSVSDASATSAKRDFTFELLAMIGSIFYGVLLVVLAGVFYLTDMTNKTTGKHQLFK